MITKLPIIMKIESKRQPGGKPKDVWYTDQRVCRKGGHRHGGLQLTLLLALVLGWLILGGCGVKAPPVPLQQPPALPAATDLAYRIAHHQVTLTWCVQSPLDRQAAKKADFVVRRFRTALDQPACENCPQVFETVGRIPYLETSDGAYALTLPLEAGFHHAFKVHLETTNRIGADSGPVQFDFPYKDTDEPIEYP